MTTYRHWLALCLSALLFSTPALAQDDDDPADGTEAASSEESNADAKRAKQIYANGVELYDEGLYEQSIQAFQEAYELSGEHKLLYNVANAQERMGDLQAVLDTLNTYRIYADEEEQEKLDRRIRSIERRYEEERVAAAEQAAAAAANSGSTETVVTTEPNTAKWIVLGSGAALAVGFGTVSAVTFASGQGFASDCETSQDPISCADNQSSYESNKTVNNISLPIAGVGAGLAVVGLVLPSQRKVSVTPGLFGATAHVQF